MEKIMAFIPIRSGHQKERQEIKLPQLKTVYLVDDNRKFLKTLRDYLEAFGDYLVLGMGTGNRATINEIIEINPDIVIVDYLMPEMDGMQIIKEIKPVVNSKIIVVTQYASEQYLAATLLAGADAFISKGDIVQRLITTIQDLF
jgi:DNA-binding NarL/FixJ family response regulator